MKVNDLVSRKGPKGVLGAMVYTHQGNDPAKCAGPYEIIYAEKCIHLNNEPYAIIIDLGGFHKERIPWYYYVSIYSASQEINNAIRGIYNVGEYEF